MEFETVEDLRPDASEQARAIARRLGATIKYTIHPNDLNKPAEQGHSAWIVEVGELKGFRKALTKR
jgi:hypothetical protein